MENRVNFNLKTDHLQHQLNSTRLKSNMLNRFRKKKKLDITRNLTY